MPYHPHTKSESSEVQIENFDLREDKSFGDYLRLVSNCLKGIKILKSGPCEKEEVRTPEDLRKKESERCMKVVRSVLDEDTALTMVKSYLQLAHVME